MTEFVQVEVLGQRTLLVTDSQTRRRSAQIPKMEQDRMAQREQLTKEPIPVLEEYLLVAQPYPSNALPLAMEHSAKACCRNQPSS